MSLSQNNLSETSSFTGLCINELVTNKLSASEDLQYLSPFLQPISGQLLSYYGKPMALTTTETKGLRKLARLFNKLAANGYIPPIASQTQAIEWGKPDGMRLGFFPLLNAFVHAKEFTLGASEVDSNLTSAQERVFVTGTCMYGKSGVTGKTDKGKILSLVDPYIMPTATYEEYGCIQSLEFQDDFHAYEVVEALSRGNILNGLNADKIYFNVPVTPYVLYAKEAISRGIMNEKLMGAWLDQLNKRAAQLVFYEQSICKGTIIPVDPLYPYLDMICDPQTTLQDVCAVLSEKDSWWEKYLDKMPIQKFADIGSASYARVYYDLLGSAESSKILFAVEDQTEMRILLEVKKLIDSNVLPKLNNASSVVGLYPFTPLIFPGSNGEANATFFYDDAGQKASVSDIFDMCIRFSDKGLVDKAKSAYAAIRSGEQNNIQFNLV